jgi:integrase
MQEDLPVICDSYLSERVVAAGYAENLRKVSARCGRLSKDRVNAYLRSRMNSVSMTTVANERRMILTLWRWAYDTGKCDSLPRGVVAIRPRIQPVKAWTVSDITNAVNTALKKKDRVMRNGASIGNFLACWLLLGYETGARWGDLWAIKEADFYGSMLRFTASKNGSHIHRVLSDDCMKLVNTMLRISPDGTVLGWVAKKRYAMRIMKEHLRECGLDGTSKWLRRSGATHVEQQQSGQAKVFLGHRTAGLAERHYIDWAQLGGNSLRVAPINVEISGR